VFTTASLYAGILFTSHVSFSWMLCCVTNFILTFQILHLVFNHFNRFTLKPSLTWHWFMPVVLNHSFESRMWFPRTLCAAFNRLSMNSVIFCVTDFVLLSRKTCQLTCGEVSLVRLSHRVVSLDLASFCDKVENTWFVPSMGAELGNCPMKVSRQMCSSHQIHNSMFFFIFIHI